MKAARFSLWGRDVLCGDDRLIERFRTPDLLPLGSRIRVRLVMAPLTPDELAAFLRHCLEVAGNPNLMTPELVETLAAHAMGNCRALMTMAGELLAVGVRRQLKQLDEKLYLEVFAQPQRTSPARNSRKRRSR